MNHYMTHLSPRRLPHMCWPVVTGGSFNGTTDMKWQFHAIGYRSTVRLYELTVAKLAAGKTHYFAQHLVS